MVHMLFIYLFFKKKRYIYIYIKYYFFFKKMVGAMALSHSHLDPSLGISNREWKCKGDVVQPNGVRSRNKALNGYIFTIGQIVLQ